MKKQGRWENNPGLTLLASELALPRQAEVPLWRCGVRSTMLHAVSDKPEPHDWKEDSPQSSSLSEGLLCRLDRWCPNVLHSQLLLSKVCRDPFPPSCAEA